MKNVLRHAAVLAALVATSGMAAADGVSVQQAWARATTPNAATGAVYLTLVSQGGDTLVGLATPVAQAAELHQSYRTGDVSGMRHLENLPVPAGQTTVLAPGGTHIMLTGLRKRLLQGQSFPLTLSFARAGAVRTTVQVEAIGASGLMPGMSAGHDMRNMPGMRH